MIAIANARNTETALIAPHARLDDGKLDLVVGNHRSAWQVLVQARRLFSGYGSGARGLNDEGSFHCHLCGYAAPVSHRWEPFTGGRSILASSTPQSLEGALEQERLTRSPPDS